MIDWLLLGGFLLICMYVCIVLGHIFGYVMLYSLEYNLYTVQCQYMNSSPKALTETALSLDMHMQNWFQCTKQYNHWPAVQSPE